MQGRVAVGASPANVIPKRQRPREGLLAAWRTTRGFAFDGSPWPLQSCGDALQGFSDPNLLCQLNGYQLVRRAGDQFQLGQACRLEVFLKCPGTQQPLGRS